MKNVLLIFFVVSYLNSFPQHKIIDANTKESVAFAAIFNKTLQTGTYSDVDGSFMLKCNKGDTVIISCVGYHTDTIFDDEKLGNTILLTPRVYNMDEIIYSINLKSKKYELGYRKERKTTAFYSEAGSEWVVFIDNPKPGTNQLIESVILKTRNKSKKTIGFRIHIYEKDSITNLPGNEIALFSLFETSSCNGKKFDLDKPVVFPSTGVFVGIEWVSYLNEKNRKTETNGNLELAVPLTFNINQPYSLFRSKFYDNTWVKVGKNHYLSDLTGNVNPPNLAASIIVKEFLNE